MDFLCIAMIAVCKIYDETAADHSYKLLVSPVDNRHSLTLFSYSHDIYLQLNALAYSSIQLLQVKYRFFLTWTVDRMAPIAGILAK